jgi:putative DNA primase/helicase
MTVAAVKHLVDSAPKFTGDSGDQPAPLPFDVVPFADLAHTAPSPPLFAWEGLAPVDHVTILGAHGGTGKTILMLMLAVCTALGRPLFDISTRQGTVAFYSGEDGAMRLRYLLHFVCRCMAVDVQALDGKLHIIDAASHDPTLFAEVAALGQREGRTTSTYEALREYLKAQRIALLIVDNASDVFAGSEIARAQVRGFMRALAKLARELHAAVILLAHVDKGTSRQERTGTEGYSGSTAWHNSARSRLFMRREADGSLVVEHQKHNLGPLHAPIRLRWPEGGIPELDAPFGPVVQGIADRGHERALLRLIAEYTARGEHVSTATNSRTHAAKVLRQEPSFPSRLKDPEVFDLLRKAERAGFLTRSEVRGANRHARECWILTTSGYAFADMPVPTAPTAPTSQVDAPNAHDAEGCADCADFSAGGMGGMARAGADA